MLSTLHLYTYKQNHKAQVRSVMSPDGASLLHHPALPLRPEKQSPTTHFNYRRALPRELLCYSRDVL